MTRRPEPPGAASRRLARVALAATAGLVAGTALQVAAGWDLAPAAGAAAGAVAAVVANRLPREGRR
ncbi:MAG TPA: hypothetical protein VNT51_00915 [Miltoncostaeaceae bacterium]|nr:hypothetical protein [Miltoncostaeaceae bacterium]